MSPPKRYKAIAAMSENRVIGNQGAIPWHLPEDFKWFKQKTMGGVLIMGRKTFESIGRPLPGRQTYIVSRQPQSVEGARQLNDLSALDALTTDKTIWIAGGAEIYRQTLEACDELFLTRVHRICEGDTLFPEFEHLFKKTEILHRNDAFTIERWIPLADESSAPAVPR